MEEEGRVYDLIIVGAGVAGLTASMYASRYRLEHLIFGVEPGGQMNEIHSIENWPGKIAISGRELIANLVEQVNHFGVEIKNDSINAVQKNADGIFEIETSKAKYLAKTVIMAMGTSYKKMNIPGEKEFIGKGVSYCATCDAMFFRNKVISVIGGGNSAAVAAITLADYAEKVYLLYRGERLSAEPIWLEKIAANPKIEVITSTNVIEIKGEAKVEKIILDKAHEDKTYLAVDGVFIEIGSEPGIELIRKLVVETDEKNFIKVGADQSTNVPGVFAAGDITTGSNKFRQLITASAEGALAANGAYKKVKL
ncbi:MAG: FAD-dependent oxidoreductase [Parcubacteria group bacterium]|jgi:thioredoxin reductase (NADPH)